MTRVNCSFTQTASCPEMNEDTVRVLNEALKDKIRVNLIINNRASGNAPLIAQKIADRLHSERQQQVF